MERALHHLPALLADRVDEDHHHILHRARERCLKEVHQQLPVKPRLPRPRGLSMLQRQPQIMQQELHQLAVARVPDRLVRDVRVLPRAPFLDERFKQRAHAARGIERLILHTLKAEPLQPLERGHLHVKPIQHDVARLAILVHHARGRPRHVVLQLVRRILRQRTHAQREVMHLVQLLRKLIRRDRDVPRRQPALRHQRHLRPPRSINRPHLLRRLDVLGHIEVVNPQLVRRLRHALDIVERQHAHHRVMPLERLTHLRLVRSIDSPCRKDLIHLHHAREPLPEALRHRIQLPLLPVRKRHGVVPARERQQHLSHRFANPARTKHQHTHRRHTRSSRR